MIDNLEGTPERDEDNKNLATGLIDAVVRYADQTLKELNERGLPCDSVNLGKGYLSKLIASSIENYEGLGLIENDSHPSTNYPKLHNLYTDATEQYIISNHDLALKHAEYYSAQSCNTAQSQ